MNITGEVGSPETTALLIFNPRSTEMIATAVIPTIAALTTAVGQGKTPGELTPGFLVFWLVCLAGVVFFWIRHARKNRK